MSAESYTDIADGTAVSCEITLNGGRAAAVRFWSPETEEALGIDSGDILSAAVRERMVERLRLPPEGRSEARAHLERLANTVYEYHQRSGKSQEDHKEAALQVFEDLDPHEEPVAGAVLLSEMADTFRRFLVLPGGGDIVLALWSLYAWAFDAFRISPILAVTSAEKGSGKSHTMDVLATMVPRPMRDSNPSDAVVFRVIQKHQPTVMLDEADNIDWRKRPELLGMVNNGYRRAGAFVWRCEGDNFDPTPFSVWSPKVLAGLKPLPDTTASRSIVLRLERKPKTTVLEELRWDRLHERTRDLRRRMLRWATDHVEALREASPDMPPEFSDRQKDNWLPLLAIADLVGGDWPRLAREAAIALRGGKDSTDQGSIGELLLADVRDAFGDCDLMPTQEILNYLTQLQDRPWAEWGHLKKPLSAQGLAAQLRKFGIHPEPKTLRDGDKTFKGYARESFVRVWELYTPVVTVPVDRCDGSETETVTDQASIRDSTLPGRVTVVTDVTVSGGGREGPVTCPCGNRDAVRWKSRVWCPRCDPIGYDQAQLEKVA